MDTTVGVLTAGTSPLDYVCSGAKASPVLPDPGSHPEVDYFKKEIFFIVVKTYNIKFTT